MVDKPAGLVVHPAPGHPGGTLVNALLHHCGDLAGIGGVLRPGIVHRLDRGTSGVMVVAKNDAAHASLAAQFHDHSVERVYLALVRGTPAAPSGRVERPIGRHPRDRKRMTVEGAAARRGRDGVARARALRRAGPRAPRGAARDRAHPPDPRAPRRVGPADRRRSRLRARAARRAAARAARAPRRRARLHAPAQRRAAALRGAAARGFPRAPSRGWRDERRARARAAARAPARATASACAARRRRRARCGRGRCTAAPWRGCATGASASARPTPRCAAPRASRSAS